MKSNKITSVKASVFLFVAALALVAATETNAQSSLQKAITAHINKTRLDATEYKKARKIIYGDIDGDGTKDAAVQYTLEGAGGGNSWGQQLAVFLNVKGKYQMAAEETVGGKFLGSFTLTKIVSRDIIGATETCPDGEPQGTCKNPVKGQMKFVLDNGKLKEM